MRTQSKRTVFLMAAMLMILSVRPAHAENMDLNFFGGIQHQGKLTFQSAPGSASSFVQDFNPKTFGVFGGQFVHGKLFRGEHTFEYAPDFIDSQSKAVLYHSNLRVQASFPIVKPYGSAGIGLVHSSGNGISSFGTKFAFNYGGGVMIGGGPIGANLDVRGYEVPRISISGFNGRQSMDFVQVTTGIVFRFK